MALQHAAQGEVIDVRPYGAALGEVRSIALFKSQDLEVIRLVFPAGHHMPAHKVAGEVTIQCIEGAVQVHSDGAPARELPAGHLMFVARGVTHALTASVASSVLVTIVL
jgi:quercetin dioxygenase-like cupin family protein